MARTAGSGVKFLVRDRDDTFVAGFNAVFASIGVRIMRTPPGTPVANCYAERWVGTVRRECTDRMLIIGERHLRTALTQYVQHYNHHDRTDPCINARQTPCSEAINIEQARVIRRNVLGGPINEYSEVA